MSQLDLHGSQWQGRGRDQSQIVQMIPQVQFVQQGCRHASGNAASGADGVSNRSRENDCDSVTMNPTRLQC